MASSPSKLRPLSDRARIYIIAAVVFAALSFVATTVAVVVVNRMQWQLVEEAKQMAREHAESLGRQLSDLLTRAPTRDVTQLDEESQEEMISLVHDYAMQEYGLTFFTVIKDGEVAYYFDRDGTEFGPLARNPTPVEELPAWLDPENPQLPEPMGGQEELRIPLTVAGADAQPLDLEIATRLSPRRIESSVKRHAQIVERSSWILVGLLLSLLLAGILMLARAVSHTVALHDEANRLDRLAYVGTLAAGLAHEIRNPLNAMSINLDLVSDDLGTASEADPTTRKLVSGVKSEIVHLNKIVENFMAYARPSRRTGETLDLAKAARDAVAVLAPQFAARGVRCEVGELPADAWVEVDPTALHQALTNILLNAAEAMDKPDKRITVGGASDTTHATLKISDNGRGIPPDQIAQVFEVFYTNKPTGSGLGLPTARRVVEDGGGEIAVDSLAGHGTTIKITLPIARRRRGRR